MANSSKGIKINVSTDKSKREKNPSKKSKRPAINLKMAILPIMILILIAGASLWFFFLRSSSSDLTNAQVIENVGALIGDLPEGETPTIATIEDAEAIFSKDGFYEGASNGDKVLVYVKSGRAIIYSPGDDAIVKDGAVSVSE